MPGRLVAKDIIPDQESIDVPGQSLQAAALGALVVEYLRPVATLDKEEGCNDEKATPNRYRCAAVPDNGGGTRRSRHTRRHILTWATHARGLARQFRNQQ
jgi:hypothetical protein